MEYVLPSSIISPGVGVLLALVSLASLLVFSCLYLNRHSKKKRTICLMVSGCLGLGTALSLFTISTSLSIADNKAKTQYQELTTVKNIFDGFNGLAEKP